MDISKEQFKNIKKEGGFSSFTFLTTAIYKWNIVC